MTDRVDQEAEMEDRPEASLDPFTHYLGITPFEADPRDGYMVI